MKIWNMNKKEIWNKLEKKIVTFGIRGDALDVELDLQLLISRQKASSKVFATIHCKLTIRSDQGYYRQLKP